MHVNCVYKAMGELIQVLYPDNKEDCLNNELLPLHTNPGIIVTLYS